MSYWDKYRNSHEPTEHWEMRKKFLEAHQKSYDEDRLLCLAQTFYNIEFLGCRYPEKVMKEIEVLSQGVADDHREAKKSKIQRTFVAASEAAESKVCRTGTKRKAEDNRKNPGVTIQGQTIHDVMRNQQRPTPQNTASGLDLRLIQKYLDREPPLSHLILLRMKTETDLNFEYLQRSAKISQVKALFHYDRSDGQIEATLRIADKFESANLVHLVEPGAFPLSKPKTKELRDKLLALADPVLKANQLCVVMDARFYSSRDVVEKTEGGEVEEEEERGGDEKEKKYISDDFEKVAESNIGSKLLRLMGWSGRGGLGKAGQGIAEPVPITGRLDKKRTGLGQDSQGRPKKGRQGPHQVLTGEDGESTMGLSVNRQDGLQGESFKAWARELLLEYLHSPNLLWFEDLIFASSFTKEERAIIHDTVQRVKELRLALLAKSYGKNLARQLIVSRKAAKDGRTILSDLILCGDNPKFSLLVPPAYHAWLAQQQH